MANSALILSYSGSKGKGEEPKIDQLEIRIKRCLPSDEKSKRNQEKLEFQQSKKEGNSEIAIDNIIMIFIDMICFEVPAMFRIG